MQACSRECRSQPHRLCQSDGRRKQKWIQYRLPDRQSTRKCVTQLANAASFAGPPGPTRASPTEGTARPPGAGATEPTTARASSHPQPRLRLLTSELRCLGTVIRDLWNWMLSQFRTRTPVHKTRSRTVRTCSTAPLYKCVYFRGKC